ncbi:MAG: hypothetical protein AAGC79_07145 [Pseudomonadota bacterium]
MMIGFSKLTSSQDLFAKQRWEHQRLETDPSNAFHGFNFFVAAWHLLEWTYPDSPERRRQLKKENVILQVCEHLAVGAKQFEPKDERHRSVLGSHSTDAWGGAWGISWSNVWGSRMIIKLAGEVAETFGSAIDCLELATHAFEFWKQQFENRQA